MLKVISLTEKKIVTCWQETSETPFIHKQKGKFTL